MPVSSRQLAILNPATPETLRSVQCPLAARCLPADDALARGGGLDVTHFLEREANDIAEGEGQEVVAPSLYGRGNTMDAWAESLLEELEGPFDLCVGASMGGGAALALERQRPGTCRSLVLAGAHAGPDRHPDRARVLEEHRDDPDKLAIVELLRTPNVRMPCGCAVALLTCQRAERPLVGNSACDSSIGRHGVFWVEIMLQVQVPKQRRARNKDRIVIGEPRWNERDSDVVCISDRSLQLCR